MSHRSSLRTLLAVVLMALSVFSVFAGDVIPYQETEITGKLSLKNGNVFITLPDGNLAVVDGRPSTIEALKSEAGAGKVVTLRGMIAEMHGVYKEYYGTAFSLGLDELTILDPPENFH
jgi:hypothetical protein